MDWMNYVIIGTFFFGALLLIAAGIYYFVADIPGAVKVLRTEDAKKALKVAKAKKYTKQLIKEFTAATSAAPAQPECLGEVDASAFVDLVFPEEVEETWPAIPMMERFTMQQKLLLNKYIRITQSEVVTDGIYLAGGESVEFIMP